MLFSLVYGMLALGTFLSGIRQVIFIVCFEFCCGERGLLRKQGNSITFRPSFLEHLTSRILAFYKAHASVPLPLYHCARLPSIPPGLNFEDWISNQRVSSSIWARSEQAETYMSSSFS